MKTNRIPKAELFNICIKEIEAYHKCIRDISTSKVYNNSCDQYLHIIQSCIENCKTEHENNSIKNQF
jgi:hypothetical protein